MATFVPLLGGGYLNLDHVVQLLPSADGTRYEACLPGRERAALDVDRATVDLQLGEPAAPRPKPRKKA